MIAVPREALTPQLLLTPRDAARALAISERSLARMTSRGEIAPVRLGAGRIVRYSIESLKALVEATTTKEA